MTVSATNLTRQERFDYRLMRRFPGLVSGRIARPTGSLAAELAGVSAEYRSGCSPPPGAAAANAEACR